MFLIVGLLIGSAMPDGAKAQYLFNENATYANWSSLSPQDKQFALNSKLLGSNTAKTANFGNQVDISGETAVVGAWYDNIGSNTAQGSAYVYVKKNGFWVEQAKLTAADGTPKLHFGNSVAIDGDTIVVGAPVGRSVKERNKGAVYVFTRKGDHWGEQIKLTPSSPTLVELFGTAVDISGDTIIAGSLSHDLLPDDKIAQAHGAAYIFSRSSGSWSERQKLTSDGLTNAGFGVSVGIHDKMAVVGTMSDEQAVGAAYVFVNDGISWKKDGKLRSGDRRSNERFALQSVAVDRGTVVVGASGSGSRQPGAAYVFNKGATGWTQTAKLVASNSNQEEQFGMTVDISGDTIVVGMIQLVSAESPRAYIFRRKMTPNGTVWTAGQLLPSPEKFPGDSFAQSVAISGDHIVIGASSHDADPQRKTRGAAYVYAAR